MKIIFPLSQEVVGASERYCEIVDRQLFQHRSIQDTEPLIQSVCSSDIHLTDGRIKCKLSPLIQLLLTYIFVFSDGNLKII